MLDDLLTCGVGDPVQVEWIHSLSAAGGSRQPLTGLAARRSLLAHAALLPPCCHHESLLISEEDFEEQASALRGCLDHTDPHSSPFYLPPDHPTFPVTSFPSITPRAVRQLLGLQQDGPRPKAEFSVIDRKPRSPPQQPVESPRGLFHSLGRVGGAHSPENGGPQRLMPRRHGGLLDRYSRATAPGATGSAPHAPPLVHPNRDPTPPLREKRERDEGAGDFVTAAQQLEADMAKSRRLGGGGDAGPPKPTRPPTRTLGPLRRGFVPPFRREEPAGGPAAPVEKKEKESATEGVPPCLLNPDGTLPDILKNIDPALLETVCNEVLEDGLVSWDDIAGLDYAKSAVYEAIILPLQRPDLCTGIRRPTKGLLLFGPPGTGKTMIGKAIASESQSTFFNISACTLMSKWVGEGEKMVRALFAVATVRQPSVVFIDEIDSLLTQRGDGEQDHTRRLKTQFLVQLEGAATTGADRVLIVGATNRPQDLDEAFRRRMEKRLYIPLPECETREYLIKKVLSELSNELTSEEVRQIAKKSEGYSGADLKNLCREAALGPIRELGERIKDPGAQVRPVRLKDFASAFRAVKATVSEKDIVEHVKFNEVYGSFNKAAGSAEDDEHFFDDV